MIMANYNDEKHQWKVSHNWAGGGPSCVIPTRSRVGRGEVKGSVPHAIDKGLLTLLHEANCNVMGFSSISVASLMMWCMSLDSWSG